MLVAIIGLKSDSSRPGEEKEGSGAGACNFVGVRVLTCGLAHSFGDFVVA